MDIRKLWIGDKVVLKKSRRVGTFEGMHGSGKARIKSEGKIILSSAANLAEYVEAPPKEDLDWIKEERSSVSFHEFPDHLDLHFEKLRSDAPDQNTNILAIQIKAFEDYFAEAKKNGMAYVTIIHGKGVGILKGEISSRIAGDPDVSWYQDINDGGAIQVKLRPPY